MSTELVLTALQQALTLHQSAPGLIIHADRDHQYTSAAYCTRLQEAGVQVQQAGNPYHNAQAEAGWNTLKIELLPSGSPFTSPAGAQLDVAHYLDTYFNLERRHSALGYHSHHQFERDFKLNLSNVLESIKIHK